MNINQENINPFLNKYISFVDELSIKQNYDNNIKHLLYVIVPAFVIKYGIENESTIFNCFNNTKIFISEHNKNVSATFNRTLKKDKNSYYTEKFITVNPFSTSSLSSILDNFIHEFNHAINSINNEILFDDKCIKVRTGLATLNYDKKDFEFIGKSKEIILEEIINTSQTEEVLNIIKSLSKYNIENDELSNTLYNIKQEIGNKPYSSDAYSYQKELCSNLINNKTFTPTINKLRFKGLIDDIPTMFDSVIGTSNNYNKLNDLLNEINELINKYSESRFFKNKYLNKIKSYSKDVSQLIDDYEKKSIY